LGLQLFLLQQKIVEFTLWHYNIYPFKVLYKLCLCSICIHIYSSSCWDEAGIVTLLCSASTLLMPQEIASDLKLRKGARRQIFITPETFKWQFESSTFKECCRHHWRCSI
jgi:hypothetical protein